MMGHRHEDMIGGVNGKSVAAWEQFYEDYYPALCSYTENVVKRADVSQDIVQELLFDLWRSERVFGSMRELTFFLYKASFNNSLHYLRTQRTRSGILSAMPRGGDMDDAYFAGSIREELVRRLHLHIQSLPPERRRIIMLSLEGHSREEIAMILGISPNTVKAQKTSALKTLRGALCDPSGHTDTVGIAILMIIMDGI